jgi:pimeloyl-ACP methyl ester carboxylesterase
MQAELESDTASDQTAIVYLPGIDGTGELLLGTAARLAESFRLLQLRYEHRTGEELVGDGYGELARSVAESIAAQGIERVLLLADSFGVSLALRTALDHPELVAGMALVNGFAYYPRRLRLALPSALAPLVPRSLFKLGRSVGAQRSLFAPRRDAVALREFRALPGAYFDAGYRQRLEMVRRVDLRPRLADIRQPVAIYASDHDRIVPAIPGAEVMAAALPDATYEVLPRAGHLVLPLAEEPWVERMQSLARRAHPVGR